MAKQPLAEVTAWRERPRAVLVTHRAFPAYDRDELAAWRAAHGFTQDQVAAFMHVSRPYVAMLEGSRRGPLDARSAIKYLSAIERMAESRAELEERGRADLEAIRKQQGYK